MRKSTFIALFALIAITLISCSVTVNVINPELKGEYVNNPINELRRNESAEMNEVIGIPYAKYNVVNDTTINVEDPYITTFSEYCGCTPRVEKGVVAGFVLDVNVVKQLQNK